VFIAVVMWQHTSKNEWHWSRHISQEDPNEAYEEFETRAALPEFRNVSLLTQVLS
jgi:hypothetical protein